MKNSPEFAVPSLNLLRILDVYLGSRISDPGSNNSNKIEGEKIFVLPFLAKNKTKLKNNIF
jgi:hypothetical protein